LAFDQGHIFATGFTGNYLAAVPSARSNVMQSIKLLVALMLIAAWALPTAQAQESTAEYSADFTFETAEMAQTGKVFAAPGKERRESVFEGGMTSVTIRREDLGKLWILMPSERMYMEVNPGQSDPSGMQSSSPDDYDVQMTVVGPEQLDGVDAIKHKVIMTDADGNKMGGFWWVSNEGIPLKMDMLAVDDGDKMRLKQQLSNVEIGTQPPELFEIPSDYNSMSMGIGMGIGRGMLGLPAGGQGDDDDDR
jgi:hypothetical protein